MLLTRGWQTMACNPHQVCHLFFSYLQTSITDLIIENNNFELQFSKMLCSRKTISILLIANVYFKKLYSIIVIIFWISSVKILRKFVFSLVMLNTYTKSSILHPDPRKPKIFTIWTLYTHKKKKEFADPHDRLTAHAWGKRRLNRSVQLLHHPGPKFSITLNVLRPKEKIIIRLNLQSTGSS